MHQGDEVPQHPEDEPGPGEGGREEEELVSPLHIHEGRPQVPQVEGAAAAHVLDFDVGAAIFGHDPPPLPERAGPSRDGASQQRLQHISLSLGVTHFVRGRAARRGGRG